MRKQKKRQPSPQPQFIDRIVVVGKLVGAIFTMLKFAEWVWSHWQHLPF